MAKSVFYLVWISDESNSLNETFKVMSRRELISFLRSGQFFIYIEPFDFDSLSERFVKVDYNRPNVFNPKTQEANNENHD